MKTQKSLASNGWKQFLSRKAFAISLLMWLITLTITAWFTGLNAILEGRVPHVLGLLGTLYVVIVRIYFRTVAHADNHATNTRNIQFESGLLQLGLLLMPFITCFAIYYQVKTSCPRENLDKRSIVHELIDSTDYFLQTDISLRVLHENCRTVSNRVQEYQQSLLSRLMIRNGIPKGCREAYEDTVHRISAEYASIICQDFGEMEQFCLELNNIVQNKDAGAIPFLFRKYNMQWETQAIEMNENSRMVARGNLQCYLQDQIQQLIPSGHFRTIRMRKERSFNGKVNEIIFVKS